jgi:hypothetical protein
MPLDRTTEAIAHFIGAFHLDVEALRLREGYDAFRAAQDMPPEGGELPFVSISVRAPHELKGFEPGLKVALPLAPAIAAGAQAVPAGAPPGFGPPLHSSPAAVFAPHPGQIGPAPTVAVPHWEVPPPNQIATATVQHLYLADDDVISFDLGLTFVPPEVLLARLETLIATAESLSLGLTGRVGPDEVTDGAAMRALAEEIAAFGPDAVPQAPGATVHLISGAAAQGTFVDGAAVEEMPKFLDNLPAALEPPGAEQEADDGPEIAPGADEPNPYAVDPGHHVETGANLSANEAFIVTNWTDAEVIAVGGDVIEIAVISQVNLLVDDAGGAPGAGPGAAPGAVSKAVSAAQIVTRSSEPEGADDAAAPIDGGFPLYWEVTRIDGDVILVNWVEQHTFATDTDRAEVLFTGSATHIGMGDNTLSNFATLTELGFHYDLIVISGDMITVNMIEQINVLLDSDSVGAVILPPDLIATGDNYLLNSAAIVSEGVDSIVIMSEAFRAELEALEAGATTLSDGFALDPLFQGKETLSVLYIDGDLIEVNVIEQHNYLGDADQVQLALDALVDGTGAEVTITTGANALLNDARIIDLGIDSTIVAGGEVYTAALIHQAGLVDTEAMPEGVAMTGLASEAVAFLADDMIDPAPPDDTGGGGAALAGEGGSLDVMQTVLA